MNRYLATGVLTLVLVFSALLSSADAMCVYNDSKYNVRALFTCGFGCSNNWKLDPNDKECRPGASGEVTVYITSWTSTPLSSIMRHVSSHGWISIGDHEVCAYHHDGTKVGCDDRW